ncbi:MAG: DNA topoisomerase I [Candidatus Zambryskibacteria bacterium CG10_big_fil_rev_8_21_14_0_10_42_12]|uniref:DNA topoisomerase 1 n=1 Tax=Candidatus Zambryskibacteria bacterium CG10_big_fil_rev_8_21_14_0_10_42_12 TaxID=1975115 RepID=A0A2H0QVE4_9BACT|nr:MAG: DNA topoisomerase I [Candidatus Zambryskibacteria bacterium CG10_big_fil_rev_8_21_14_0_10_42_12]
MTSTKNATGKKLLIVESPAKAKTIGKYLGGDFLVTASVGHIRDLPKSNKKAVDIEKGFLPHYEISKGKEKVVSDIKALAKNASEVYLATDPDREGEAIAWHIAEAAKLSHPKRVVFHEITKDAVAEAIKHPRDIDENLRRAQEARRVLDRLVGYDLSGLIWKKVRYGLSAGRVQSPALRILMEREREIRAFIPETFYVIEGLFKTKSGDDIKLTCSEEPRDKKQAEEILEKGKTHDWSITDVKETEAKRSPRPPFTTSTLQQAASSRLGFSPSRTMGIAQKLYEAGHITYMRTDSTNLSGLAYSQIKKYVEEEFGSELYQNRAYKTKSKNAQEAHEAIRPTNCLKTGAGNTDEQKRLYRLIWQRTVSSQMQDAKIMRTRIEANITDTSIPHFAITGSRVISPGWLLADPQARGEDVELPKVTSGEPLALLSLDSEEKQTEPPHRYTEAGLVKELEKRDIGRPSTYASIIKTIVDRGYVEKNGRTLIPTDTGDVVSTFLENNFMKYISDSFTAEMENELDEIAEGKRDYTKTLTDFYKPFTKDVEAKENSPKITDLGKADSKWKCPKCSSPMIIKLGRGGKFMSCERFPDCEGARTITGEEIKDAEPLGTDPESELPVFVLDGRFGPYVQLGELEKGKKTKPKRASLPKDKKMDEVTLDDALTYLSLPRILGNHPDTGKEIVANNGRFGPYIVHDGDFRSLKEDDVYKIELPRALEILKEPKKTRRGRTKKK